MNRRILFLSIACLVIILPGCGHDEPLAPGSPTSAQIETGTAPDKPLGSQGEVVRNEYSYPVDLDEEEPFVYCYGELMQYHGMVEVHIVETTTPSGQMIVRAWVDYNAYSGVSIEEISTGDTWTLQLGHNPFGEVIKENGFYMLHYQWHELFVSSERGMLHVHVGGHFTIAPDGSIMVDRETVTCH